MVLGEDSAHARLQDLLRHYSGSPLSPYGETLSQPLARQVRPPSSSLTLTLTLTSAPSHQALSPAGNTAQPRPPAHLSLGALREGGRLGRESLRDQPRHQETWPSESTQSGAWVICGFYFVLLF